MITKANAANPGGCPTHWPNILFLKGHTVTQVRADQDVILPRRQNDIVQFILIFQVERNQTVAADIGKFLDRCPFNYTVLGDEE